MIGRIDAVWGYHVGDAVRARVATALRADVLRPDDLVGIAMYPADGDQAESLLQRTRNANRAFAMLAMLNLSIWGRPLTGEVRPA